MTYLKCVSSGLQETIKDYLKKKIKNETIYSQYFKFVDEAIPICRHDRLIEFGQDGDTGSRNNGNRKRSKKKRKASEYNKFIGECIKNRPDGMSVTERMKECGKEWKRMKMKQ